MLTTFFIVLPQIQYNGSMQMQTHSHRAAGAAMQCGITFTGLEQLELE